MSPESGSGFWSAGDGCRIGGLRNHGAAKCGQQPRFELRSAAMTDAGSTARCARNADGKHVERNAYSEYERRVEGKFARIFMRKTL